MVCLFSAISRQRFATFLSVSLLMLAMFYYLSIIYLFMSICLLFIIIVIYFLLFIIYCYYFLCDYLHKHSTVRKFVPIPSYQLFERRIVVILSSLVFHFSFNLSHLWINQLLLMTELVFNRTHPSVCFVTECIKASTIIQFLKS